MEAVAVPSPSQEILFFLYRLAVPVLLCQSFNSCTSPGSG